MLYGRILAGCFATMIAMPAFAGEELKRADESPTEETQQSSGAGHGTANIAATESPSAAIDILDPDPSVLNVSNLIGMEITSQDGKPLGKVEDVLLRQDGSMAGIVVSSASLLGIGGKKVAVSWTRLPDAVDADSLQLPLTQEQLAEAPEYQPAENSATDPAANSGGIVESIEKLKNDLTGENSE